MSRFLLKRSLSQAIAIFISMILSHYVGLAESCWFLLATILVMQTTTGVALRQGVENYLGLVAGVILGTCLAAFFHLFYAVIAGFAVLIFSAICYFAERRSLKILIFGWVCLFALLSPNFSYQMIYARFYDISLGTLIGIMANLFILPIRLEVEFRQSMIQILNAYSEYFSAIVNVFLQPENNQEKVDVKKQIVEEKLGLSKWVYETGLNVGFQPGFRHFNLMIERMGQILFAMHQIARQSDQSNIQEFKEPFILYAQEVQNIIAALITVLNLKKISEGISDLEEEINTLENIYQRMSPRSLALIEKQPEYIYLADWLMDLKDLRYVLMRLVKALR